MQLKRALVKLNFNSSTPKSPLHVRALGLCFTDLAILVFVDQ